MPQWRPSPRSTYGAQTGSAWGECCAVTGADASADLITPVCLAALGYAARIAPATAVVRVDLIGVDMNVLVLDADDLGRRRRRARCRASRLVLAGAHRVRRTQKERGDERDHRDDRESLLH